MEGVDAVLAEERCSEGEGPGREEVVGSLWVGGEGVRMLVVQFFAATPWSMHIYISLESMPLNGYTVHNNAHPLVTLFHREGSDEITAKWQIDRNPSHQFVIRDPLHPTINPIPIYVKKNPPSLYPGQAHRRK